MDKSTINNYLNALYLKSKNDLGVGCNIKLLSGLLGMDKRTTKNVLYYLSSKGFIDSKDDYSDNISLTAKGFDFVETQREGKEYTSITFYDLKTCFFVGGIKFGFLFGYTLVDEKGERENKTIKVLAYKDLCINWGLGGDKTVVHNSKKILLQFAKDYILNKLVEGTLTDNEEFTLVTSSHPKTCPYDPANLVGIEFAEYEVEMTEKNKPISKQPNEANETRKLAMEHPIVFISYSWDDKNHKEWILNLAKRLLDKGIDVILDQFELGPGKNMIHFMESSIPKAGKVLIIFTQNYKLKAEKREGGVGVEYSILNAELYRQIATNKKFIPVLKSGSFSESIPAFMQQFIAVDMTNPDSFEEKLSELVYAIYDKPVIRKPKLGTNPF